MRTLAFVILILGFVMCGQSILAAPPVPQPQQQPVVQQPQRTTTTPAVSTQPPKQPATPSTTVTPPRSTGPSSPATAQPSRTVTPPAGNTQMSPARVAPGPPVRGTVQQSPPGAKNPVSGVGSSSAPVSLQTGKQGSPPSPSGTGKPPAAGGTGAGLSGSSVALKNVSNNIKVKTDQLRHEDAATKDRRVAPNMEFKPPVIGKGNYKTPPVRIDDFVKDLPKGWKGPEPPSYLRNVSKAGGGGIRREGSPTQAGSGQATGAATASGVYSKLPVSSSQPKTKDSASGPKTSAPGTQASVVAAKPITKGKSSTAPTATSPGQQSARATQPTQLARQRLDTTAKPAEVTKQLLTGQPKTKAELETYIKNAQNVAFPHLQANMQSVQTKIMEALATDKQLTASYHQAKTVEQKQAILAQMNANTTFINVLTGTMSSFGNDVSKLGNQVAQWQAQLTKMGQTAGTATSDSKTSSAAPTSSVIASGGGSGVSGGIPTKKTPQDQGSGKTGGVTGTSVTPPTAPPSQQPGSFIEALVGNQGAPTSTLAKPTPPSTGSPSSGISSSGGSGGFVSSVSPQSGSPSQTGSTSSGLMGSGITGPGGTKVFMNPATGEGGMYTQNPDGGWTHVGDLGIGSHVTDSTGDVYVYTGGGDLKPLEDYNALQHTNTLYAAGITDQRADNLKPSHYDDELKAAKESIEILMNDYKNVKGHIEKVISSGGEWEQDKAHGVATKNVTFANFLDNPGKIEDAKKTIKDVIGGGLETDAAIALQEAVNQAENTQRVEVGFGAAEIVALSFLPAAQVPKGGPALIELISKTGVKKWPARTPFDKLLRDIKDKFGEDVTNISIKFFYQQ